MSEKPSILQNPSVEKGRGRSLNLENSNKMRGDHSRGALKTQGFNMSRSYRSLQDIPHLLLRLVKTAFRPGGLKRIFRRLLDIDHFKKPPFISPTFCVYPWMEFMVGPGDYFRICCVAKGSIKTESGEDYKVVRNSLNEVWNSYGLREVRRKMLAGEKVSACSHCYYQESVGRLSYRESANAEWLSGGWRREILRRIKTSRSNGCRVDRPPLYMDIRPGNLCNLKCRMCNPGNSSKIQQEYKELLRDRKEEISPLIGNGYFNRKKTEGWWENPALWKDIHSWMPEVKQLYFTGGEPTLIEQNRELLDYVKKEGLSKKMYLTFNLNCTHIPAWLIDTVKNFKQVSFCLSVDGYREVQEYIRFPSKWRIIEKNIRKILKTVGGNVQVAFTPVMQVYNILHFTDLLFYIDRLQKEFGFEIKRSLLLCTDPSYLDIAILPQNVRDKALKKISAYRDTYCGRDSYFLENLKSVENILQTQFKSSETILNRFFQYTRILDEKRGNNFKKTFSELDQLLREREG